MIVCAFSDPHGQFENLNIEKSDILFICGDIVPLKMQRNIPQSLSWFKKNFIPWCKAQPVEQIYMVGGNHDQFLESAKREAKELLIGTNITLLYNEGCEYLDENTGKIYTIWGSPLCHRFGNWAFMYSDEFLEREFKLLPRNTDFLITHDAAYNHSDQCLGFSNPSEKELHRGCIPLLRIIENRRPRFHFFGHLHSCNHNVIDYNGTKTACVSLLNERYERVYKPLYIKL